MDDLAYPSNKGPGKQPEEKKLTAIVDGAVRRKQPMSKRVFGSLIQGDASSVFRYILEDVALPAAKDMLTSMVSEGIERMVYGDSRSSTRRSTGRPSGTGGYINYNRMTVPPRSEPRTGMSRTARSQHEFDEIVIPSRPQADDVLVRLEDLIDRYKVATVSDLYELVGESSSFADEKWGWTDIRDARVKRVRDGYLLEMPRPEPVD